MTYNGIQVVTPAPAGAGGLAINNNFMALSTHVDTVNPAAGNDSTQNFAVGSRWYNSSTTVEWVCLDNTASAAVWTAVDSGALADYLPLAGGALTGSVTTTGTVSATGTDSIGSVPSNVAAVLGGIDYTPSGWGGTGLFFSAYDSAASAWRAFSMVLGGDGTAYFGDPVTGTPWMNLSSTTASFVGAVKPGAVLELKSYTSGTLPAEVDGGLIFVSDARNPGEGTGAGTGCVCFGKAGAWCAVWSGVALTA